MPTNPIHLLKALFEGSPEAVVVADTDRRVVDVNPAFLDLFGYEPDTAFGQKTEFLYASPDDFRDLGRRRFNPSAPVDTSPVTVTFRRANGDVFAGETTGVPIIDEAGVTVGFVGIIRDVSRRVRLNETLRRLYETAADYRASSERRVERMLELGCRYFGLDMGIASQIKGETYTVDHVYTPDGGVGRGTQFKLGDVVVHAGRAAGFDLGADR